MIYHPGMIRPVLVVQVALTVALTTIAGAGVAHAEPPPPCSFTLSAPEVVQVNGVDMVTATAALAGCGPGAGPYVSVACVQLQGNDLSSRCMQAHGTDAAQVYYGPYRPGATYVASGRGCATWLGQSPAPLCQILGPNTAAL